MIVLAGAPRSFEQDLLAATLSVPDSAGSHESAGQIHRMQGVPRDRIVLTAPKGANHRLRIAMVHESTDLKARDITHVQGIAVTTRARTLCDLGRVLGLARLKLLLAQQLRAGNVSLAGIYEVFYRYARRGRPGITRIRTALEEHGRGFAVAESELELRTLRLFDARGVPRPECQVVLDFWEALVGRVDFVWLLERVIVEVDGWLFHGPDTFETDRERDNAAGLAGWRVLRFTWTMVTERPDYVVATVLEALRQGRRSAEG